MEPIGWPPSPRINSWNFLWEEVLVKKLKKMLADCCKTILHDMCCEIQDGKSTSFWWLVTFWFEKGPDSRRAGTEERLPSWGGWISEGAEVCIMNERWSFLSSAQHYLEAGEAVINKISRVAYTVSESQCWGWMPEKHSGRVVMIGSHLVARHAYGSHAGQMQVMQRWVLVQTLTNSEKIRGRQGKGWRGGREEWYRLDSKLRNGNAWIPSDQKNTPDTLLLLWTT